MDTPNLDESEPVPTKPGPPADPAIVQSQITDNGDYWIWNPSLPGGADWELAESVGVAPNTKFRPVKETPVDVAALRAP